jgi:hypothetical protein
MDGKVVFCKDGILRFKSDYEDNRLVPVVSIQKLFEYNDSKMFLQLLKYAALIESGSTIGSFILCLEPWAESAGDYLDRDVKAYVDAIKKPSTLKNAFDEVVIKRTVQIGRDIDYGKMPDDMDFLEWLNTDKEPNIENTFEIDTTICVNGYMKGNANNYSMSCTNIHELKNVALILERTIHFSEYKDSRITNQGFIMNEGTSGVFNAKNLVFAETKDDIYIKLQTLIEAVFCDGLFYHSPAGADHTREILTALKDDIDNQKELDEEDIDEIEDEENSGKKKIVVADGAFDSIIRHSNAEKDEWDFIIKNIKTDNKYSVRIGKLDEDKPSEKRIFGLILDENNNVIRSRDEESEE